MPEQSDVATRSAPAAPQRMTPRQKLILSLLLGAQFMLAADFSILTVALPVIGRGLGFTVENLQWIVTGFILPAAGFTLLFGRVGDLFGRRKLFIAGMALLTSGSLLGALATTPTMLIVARAAQGLATAMTVPAALSLLTSTFPEGPLRERAMGLNGALLTGGFTFGALFGGVLTDVLSWRWAFIINLPIAVTILIGALTLIPVDRSRERTSLDVPGAVTVTGGLLALIYGVTTAGRQGWGDSAALSSLAIAVVLLTAFWLIEERSSNPLAPMHVLKRRTVGWGNFGGLIIFSMASAATFLMTLYLQDVLHYSPLATGMAFAAAGVAAIAGGTVAPRFIERIGSPASLTIGLAMQGLGFTALLFAGLEHSGVYVVIAALGVAFFGHAYGIVSYMVTVTSGLPDEDQGLATGLITMSQQVALTLGIPILSAIAIARAGALEPTTSALAATLGGIHLAIVVDVAVNLAAAGLVALFLWRGAHREHRVRSATRRAEPVKAQAVDGTP
jgi:EmrB/QacA subfamily drug resistance transporter